MDSRYPGTRARTSTDSTATKRPTYSSWSAICLVTGFAIVTCGGGGADFGCDWLCPQAASAGAIITIAAIVLFFIVLPSRTVARTAARPRETVVRERAQYKLPQGWRTHTRE